MNRSTKKVLKRTLASSHDHLELDHLSNYEEKFADVSIEYKAYTDYDVAEIPIIDASVIKDLKEKTDLMRLTHENVPNTSSYFKDLAKCYIDNNMYPVPFFFKGQK